MTNESSMIAEPTMVVPRDFINLKPSVGTTKIRQLETVNIQPVAVAYTPINTVKRAISSTVAQVNTQVVRSPGTGKVTVGVQTPTGSLLAQSSANADAPVSVQVVRSRVPSAISIQSSTATGANTSAAFGSSLSRSINLS